MTNPDKTAQKNAAQAFRPARSTGKIMLALAFGAGFGWLVAMGCTSSKPRSDLDLNLMAQASRLIHKEYVDRSAVQPRELTYGAISGMVDALGDTGHSTFLTPAMVKEMKRMEKGEFKGIGVEIRMKDGHLVVVAPIDGSPAQRAGLRPGDIILKIFGQDVTDWPMTRVVERITGPPGTPVRLTIQSPHTGHTRQLTVMRASIHVQDVTWQQLPGTRIAHVRLASFDNGVTRELRKTLRTLKQQNLEGIILDLRNNPGGILDEAVGVASQFLRGGNVLLMKDAANHVSPVPVEKGGLAPDLPLAVLINQGSASAAEIVAGAIQDAHRAPLIGEKTFGTGTVLGQFGLSDGSELLLAIEEWLTPHGRSFWHKGLLPDEIVTLPSDATPLLPAEERELTPAQFQASEDRQLLRAVDELNRPSPVNHDTASVVR